MFILGIETSCDETSVGVVKDGQILSNIILTQVTHSRYGGVVPEIASREHTKHIVSIVSKAIESAEITFNNIGAIAVTRGPGLVGCLLIGVSYARNLGLSLGIPVIGINHLEGHIAVVLNEVGDNFPLLALVASGGHTSLVVVNGFRKYQILGRTRDDAAGEAFDKGAKLLGLGYPGGAELDKLAEQGNPDIFPFPSVKLKKGKWDFSFSGIKTALALKIKEFDNGDLPKADIAAGFRKAVVKMLISKLHLAIEFTRCKSFAIVGGVARNNLLREEVQKLSENTGVPYYIPIPDLCGDNGAMIAIAGEMTLKQNLYKKEDFEASPYLPLTQ
ncbi:MAG: tRNA (adenosine(37)-N6)-threonylcarbamoyltransferase complex transferase subunit TsaD [candidate division Zixibacteria bacterium]|nr:tRNA (adenosine(37)-N6)-threonylcarbamoyltransferase complex transferase subunit TsaD [candidate division Zixibacteria bacterium]